MKSIFLSLLVILFLGSCTTEDSTPSDKPLQWNPLGLGGHVVNKVQVSHGKIYAATDQGFFSVARNAGNQSWELLGFENQICQTFLIIDENEIIVSLVDWQDDSQTGLYKTTDGGQTWVEFTNGFGGDEGVEAVNDIIADPNDPTTLYASGQYVVARSTDGGLSWTPIFGFWQGFASGIDVVRVNPQNSDHIWAGGQNAIEQGIVMFSSDGGAEWNEWLNLLPAPSVAKEIIFHPNRPAEVYIGMEGGLIMTPNNGNDWNTLISREDSKFFFGLAIHEANPDRLYTAGWLKRFEEPQPFIIYSSNDDGTSWQEHAFDPENFGGVLDMQLLREDGQDKLYLGLHKGGVYEVVFK